MKTPSTRCTKKKFSFFNFISNNLKKKFQGNKNIQKFEKKKNKFKKKIFFFLSHHSASDIIPFALFVITQSSIRFHHFTEIFVRHFLILSSRIW